MRRPDRPRSPPLPLWPSPQCPTRRRSTMAAPSRKRAHVPAPVRLACATALLGVLAVALPEPSHARPRDAIAPGATTPVERALTGGLVTLRAPGSGMIRVT